MLFAWVGGGGGGVPFACFHTQRPVIIFVGGPQLSSNKLVRDGTAVHLLFEMPGSVALYYSWLVDDFASLSIQDMKGLGL